MTILGWATRYSEITNEFGYAKKNDIQSSRLLNSLISKKNHITDLKELVKNKHKVVAVSPIIGDSTVSGPAGKYMEAAGLEVSAYGLAKFYADVCSNLVIDTKDRAQVKKIEALNMRVSHTAIKMTNKKTEDALGSFLLKK